MAPRIFNLALNGCECSASSHDRFIPEEGASGANWLGGLVGFRVGLDFVAPFLTPAFQP